MLSFKRAAQSCCGDAPCDLRFEFQRALDRRADAVGGRPKQGALFVFGNRRRNRLKLLTFDGTGVFRAGKRLEAAISLAAECGEPTPNSVGPASLAVVARRVDLKAGAAPRVDESENLEKSARLFFLKIFEPVLAVRSERTNIRWPHAALPSPIDALQARLVSLAANLGSGPPVRTLCCARKHRRVGAGATSANKCEQLDARMQLHLSGLGGGTGDLPLPATAALRSCAPAPVAPQTRSACAAGELGSRSRSLEPELVASRTRAVETHRVE